jgi:hypothetical protein
MHRGTSVADAADIRIGDSKQPSGAAIYKSESLSLLNINQVADIQIPALSSQEFPIMPTFTISFDENSSSNMGKPQLWQSAKTISFEG